MAATVAQLYQNYLLYNWDMLVENSSYYLELESLTTFQKIEELYDLMIYFLERQEFENCIIIQENLETIKEIYRKELIDKGKQNDTGRKSNAKGSKKTPKGKTKI